MLLLAIADQLYPGEMRFNTFTSCSTFIITLILILTMEIIPGVPTKYKCSACSEHIQDISTHLISSDHGGRFKIGLYTTDNLTKQSGYVSLKFVLDLLC